MSEQVSNLLGEVMRLNSELTSLSDEIDRLNKKKVLTISEAVSLANHKEDAVKIWFNCQDKLKSLSTLIPYDVWIAVGDEKVALRLSHNSLCLEVEEL